MLIYYMSLMLQDDALHVGGKLLKKGKTKVFKGLTTSHQNSFGVGQLLEEFKAIVPKDKSFGVLIGGCGSGVNRWVGALFLG